MTRSNLTELDKKRRFADSEECKKLKIYGDFSLLLGSRADAVEYFHWIVEKIYQLCDKKDPKWLAGGYECLVAVQYMILKKKYDFNAEKYTSEKRESAYTKIARALKIYGAELQNYNKAAACFIKFAKFFKIMNMKDYYHKMLTENMSILTHTNTSIIHKISCADLASQFGYFRTCAFLLYNAHEQFASSLGNALLPRTSIQRSEIIMMMIQVLGIYKNNNHISKLAPNCSSKPLLNRPIIIFILNALYSFSFTIDKRYALCMIFLLTLMVQDKEKEKFWESIISTSPNLDGDAITYPLDVPYFSYIYVNPNSRKILQRKAPLIGQTTTPDGQEKKVEGLFLYDPRKSKVASINWCSLTTETINLYLYNPLPFQVSIDSIEVVTKNVRIDCHSGKVVLRPNEQRKKITLSVKILDEGEMEITGVMITIRKLVYFVGCGPNGIISLVKEYPDLPMAVGTSL